MSTTRRGFIKQGISAASAGLLLPKINEATVAPSCRRLDASPDIRILFTGLMLFRFDPKGFCDVEILNKLSDHKFNIEVRRKKGQSHPSVEKEYHDPLKNLLELKVDKPKPGTEGVCKFVPGNFSRSSTTNNKYDLRWALHLKEFHDPEPDFKKDHVQPGIRFFGGHFHTFEGTEGISITSKCGSTKDLFRVPSYIGANIYLSSGGSATLEGLETPYTMPQEAGVTYQIDIRNQPPFIERPRPGREYESHFHKYYSAMTSAPAQQCKVVYQLLLRATPDVPCMGLIVGE